jgi:hypothetical protein
MSALPLHDSGGDHISPGSQATSVPAGPSPAGTKELSITRYPPSRLEDSLLLIYADALDDLERVRIATENRVRALRQVKGMADSPEELRLASMVEAVAALEHGAELELKRALRKHSLGPWVKRTVGVGEKQGARLLAAIGDPATRRGPAQLWAYCGLHVLHPGHTNLDFQGSRAGVQQLSDTSHIHDVLHRQIAGIAPRSQRGQQDNWNATAKMRAFLVAESCIKQRHSPYRLVYDDGRTKYAESVHAHPCPRCGPKGHPAEIGSPLSDGHKHARAMRLVMKAILKDLWREARASA